MDNLPHRQVDLFSTGDQSASLSRPVQCLGLTFANDEERRKYFTEKLSEKLQDPEFRTSEGFPFGTDEDILALSDPPYYTACPNPWLGDFIREWEAQKLENPQAVLTTVSRLRSMPARAKPMPLYKAHSYHTKVPHLGYSAIHSPLHRTGRLGV